MDKVLIVDADKCTGCRVCELICSITKQGKFNPRESYIRILFNNEFGVYIPVLKMDCDFCGRCIEWCPPQALKIVDPKEAALMRTKSKMGRFPIPVVSGEERG